MRTLISTMRFLSIRISIHLYCRVENIAEDNSLEADFSELRQSISSLQEASSSLDHEKHSAERQLRKILHKILKHRQRSHGLGYYLSENLCSLKRALIKVAKSLGFGSKCSTRDAVKEKISGMEASDRLAPREGRALGMIKEAKRKAEKEVNDRIYGQGHKHEKGHHGHHSPNKWLMKKLAKAVKRVQAANKKLISFERGFIHEDGLKDREWYRHLGVAPGKWLGQSSLIYFTSCL